MRFGWLPIAGKPSPFLDIRLRQALAMAVNRDEFIDAFANVSNFEASGVPVSSYYYTTQGYVPELTLDPRDAGNFGANAKFYEYNLEEAKKLFDAAESAYGGSFPEIKSHAVATVFGPNYTAESEAMDGYARELGLNIVNEQLDYNTGYLPNFVTKRGQFEGILYGIGAVTSSDMTDYYLWRYYSKTGATSGQLGHGGPDGSLGDGSGDSEADALIVKATEEFDPEARTAIFHELQRYLSEKQYMVVRGGFADTFALAWPAASNFAYFQNDSRVNLSAELPFNPMSMWLDTSQPHG
jgi:ABC-type transport system substrate-binding protein